MGLTSGKMQFYKKYFGGLLCGSDLEHINAAFKKTYV